ncbi:MAG: cobalamin-dependent protein [Clostridia bacterium]|nr:cobalamin-dependent protein [Clostridia bacterium]
MMNDTSKLNIYHEIFSCEKVYDAEKAWTELKAHDDTEVSMVIGGNGIHLVLDQAIPCKEGDIFVTPSNIPHRFFLENDGEHLTVRQLRFFIGEDHASFEKRCGLFQDGSVTAYAMLNRSMTEQIGALYDAIEQEIMERKKLWRDAVGSNLSLLLINVERYIDSSIKNHSAVSTNEWNVVLTAIQIIKNNCADVNLTQGSLAETLGISKAHLSRIFQNLTGKGFAEYLRTARIEYACKLLRESKLTVEEIVAGCGLRDVPSFYKNFQAYTGITPSEYRRAIIQDNEKNKNNNTTSKGERIMVVLSEISENLQKGKAKIVKELVQQAIDEGANPEQILNEGLLDGMNIIGEKFKNNEVYVPEVLVAARAMNMGTQILKPYLAANGVQATGKVCIGTVQGDLHDIGKNLVKMMMEGKGLEVVDLGTDVAPQTFVQTAIEQNCRVICCSALLTTTMGVMEEVVKAAEAAGIRDKVKIMVGGAPVNEDFCKKIGADCYTVDAASAADAAVAFCKA